MIIENLIEDVRQYLKDNPITQEQQDEFAINFVLGNLNASTNHHTTRDKVEAKYYKLQRDKLQKDLDIVDSVLSVHWVGPRKDGDYRLALHHLVTTAIREHDDPKISEVAAKRRDELERLRRAVLNQCADNVCWLDDPDKGKLIPREEFLKSCERYRDQLEGANPSIIKLMTIAQLEAEIETLRVDRDKIEYELRRTLWMNHGHIGLYGDDGEMQCGRCMLDFKRHNLDVILDKLRALSFTKLDVYQTNLDKARGALADIALAKDMTLEQVQHKAKRIYDSTENEIQFKTKLSLARELLDKAMDHMTGDGFAFDVKKEIRKFLEETKPTT